MKSLLFLLALSIATAAVSAEIQPTTITREVAGKKSLSDKKKTKKTRYADVLRTRLNGFSQQGRI